MKVLQEKSPFIPVTITLESQHEVDTIFALLNHGSLSRAVGLEDASEMMDKYYSHGYKCIHEKIIKLMK